jgi:hypothetical protein
VHPFGARSLICASVCVHVCWLSIERRLIGYLQSAGSSGLTKNQKKKLKRKMKRVSGAGDSGLDLTQLGAQSAAQPEQAPASLQQQTLQSGAHETGATQGSQHFMLQQQQQQQQLQAPLLDAPSSHEHSQWQDAEPSGQPQQQNQQQNGVGHHSQSASGSARRTSVTMADADVATGGVARPDAAAEAEAAAAVEQEQHDLLLLNGGGQEHGAAAAAAHSRAAAAQASEAAGDMRRSRRGDVRLAALHAPRAVAAGWSPSWPGVQLPEQ